MAETSELIVEFSRGCDEAHAPKVAEAAGATVDRRLRSDHPDLVMLLIRFDAGAADRVRRTIDADPKVVRSEPNSGGYRAL